MTPLPTGTAVVPAVLSENIFRPGKGQPLIISIHPLEDGHCTVRVFNMVGEKVREPFNSDVPANVWLNTSWDGSNEGKEVVGAGIYIVSVQGAGIHKLMKVVLLK